jgi:hypothetical protein
MVTCKGCGVDVEPLDLFPRQRCLACHAKAFDLAVGLGVHVPTADGVARMWSGK